MSSRPTISERAIAAREARHRARRQGAQVAQPVEKPTPIDPWCTAGAPGSWGRGDSQEQSEPREGFLERAAAALTNPDRRFEMLARRVDQLFRW